MIRPLRGLPQIVSELRDRWLGRAPSRCVVSSPKSGRTWLRVMLDDLGIRADYTHAGPKVKGEMHFKDLSTELPKHYDRVLILIRDPRDTVVSGYHHLAKRSKRYSGSMSDYIRDPMHGIEKRARFNLLWAEFAAGNKDAMVATYEDMRTDAAAVLAAVARFFGTDPSRREIEEVVARNEFSKMQERERSGEFAGRYGSRLLPADSRDVSTFKVRRGLVGGYADELSAEDVLYVQAVLERLDYFDRLARLTVRTAGA